MSVARFSNYANDKRLAQVERARLIPPDEAVDDAQAPAPKTEGEREWKLACERAAIRDHMRKHKYDFGLFGEAVNEHALAADIRAAFFASDVDAIGHLVDHALREYIGAVAARTEDHCP